MAKWRAGPERAYVALPHRDNPNERVTRVYREGDVFELPDDMKPSRTWRPMDDAARKVCERIEKSWTLKEAPPEPDDPWDEKSVAKFRSLRARWEMQQDTHRTWFGPDPYQAQQPAEPATLHEMAAAAGKSVRVSDTKV